MYDFIITMIRIALAASSPAAPPDVPPAQPAIVEVAAPAVTAAPSNKANDVVDQVQKFYANIKQVTAQFRQSVTYDTFGSTKTSDGQVYIQKPGKMRWDYLEKKKDKVVVKKSFISNGTNLYVVEHDNLQVVKKNLQQD